MTVRSVTGRTHGARSHTLRYFLAFFLPTALILGGVTIAIYRERSHAMAVHLGAEEQLDVAAEAEALRTLASVTIEDLLFLARIQEFAAFFDATPSQAQTARTALEEEFLSLSSVKKVYDRICFLDSTGMEIIRVDSCGGQPEVVPVEQLGHRAHSYFARTTYSLDDGEVYVSPLDSTGERGRIERDSELVLRLGTPVFDAAGWKRGIVVIDYPAKGLLRALDSHLRPRDVPPFMLVGAGGNQVARSPPSDASQGQRTVRFSERFPKAWDCLSREETGQIHTRRGLFTFQTVYPNRLTNANGGVNGSGLGPISDPPGGPPSWWKVVSCIPASYLSAVSDRTVREVTGPYVALVLLVAIGSFGLAVTVDRHRRMEQALAESEERFRALAENLPGVVFSYDVDPVGRRTPVYVGSGLADLIGAAAARKIGQGDMDHFLNLIHPDDRRIARKGGRMKPTSADPIDVEYRIQSESDDYVWVRHVSRATRLRTGAIRWHGVLLDVSDRRRAEQALHKGLREYRMVTDMIPALLSYVDTHRIYRFVNKKYSEWFGLEREDMIGKPVREVLGVKVYESIKRYVDVALSGRPAAYEILLPFEKGGDRWVDVTYTPDLNEAGDVNGFFCLCKDITDRKKTEQQLRDRTKALEAANQAYEDAMRAADAANEAKSEFLANMSHEIRTPMTAILGYTEVLIEENQDREPCLEKLAVVQRNSRHLLRLIDDILDLSKVEAGKMPVAMGSLSTCESIQEVVSLMQGGADAKGLSLQIEYDGPVPETIHTDSTRVRQILINLIGNAVKFTQAGSIRIVVRFVEADTSPVAQPRLPDRRTDARAQPLQPSETPPEESRRPAIQIDVVDSGIGMTEAQVQKLFQPFAQADPSTTRRFGGTGLGLALSRRFAHMLGGSIVVESRPGIGSTFRLTLPTGPLEAVRMIEYPAQPPRVDPKDSARTLPAGDTSLRGRILLAEDGLDNQRLITMILQRAGAEVIVAENGELAVKHALSAREAGHPFGVILMDMQMPVMDGYAATRRLRDAGCDEPIIALTAHAMTGDREKCIRAGCDEYMAKPIERARLLRTVSIFLRQAPIPAL